MNDICLGKYYFQTAIRLRESYLVNGLLFNSEVWYDLKEKDIRELEGIDEALLRKILNAHSKTPLEALYLELGVLPLRFIIKARRINYLRYLANLKENELLYNFYKAQKTSPGKGDWITTVLNDIEDIGLKINVDKLRGVSKMTFKKCVKKQVYDAAFKYLLLKALPTNHSKMRNLKYKKFEMQNYFKDGNISRYEAQTYFKFRTRMEDFSDNFKNGSVDNYCRLCYKFNDKNEQYEDSQQHFLNCNVMLKEEPAISELVKDKIYSTKKVDYHQVKILIKAIEKRSELLET